MKTYIFKRESNDFDDILADPAIKPKFKLVLSWENYLMIGTEMYVEADEIDSYIMLKYGDEIVTDLIKDFSPIPYVDYQPDPNRPKKFKNVYK